jgi:hypothetical protein
MPPGSQENPDVAQDNQQNEKLEHDELQHQGMGEKFSHAAPTP